MRKLIILEINEVPFRIFDHYTSQHPETTLTKILNSSNQYVTKSTDVGELHPWSTWPTFYRGVDNTKHLIKDIGEDLSNRNKEYPPIWDLLTSNYVNSGVFASLHTYPLPQNLANYAFLVPDPFAKGPETHPRSIIPFQDFNLSMTKKSGRSVDRGIYKGKALKLALTFPIIGLRIKTIFKILMQLLDERREAWKASRRRTFQSIVAFDLFMKQLKKHKPEFVTFFSNHIASAMHRYWAATFPDDYTNNSLPKQWISRYKNEIPFCMDQLNSMIIDIHNFIKKNPDYKLIIATSMGQEATKAQLINQELFLTDQKRFKDFIGCPDLEFVAAMHPQYNFQVGSNFIQKVKDKLSKIKLNGEPLKFRLKDDNFFSIDLGYPDVEQFVVNLDGSSFAIKDLGFEIKKIDDQSAGTAYHIPEGSLFVYDINNPVENTERKEVDLREVAPAILEYFGVPKPSYMRTSSITI